MRVQTNVVTIVCITVLWLCTNSTFAATGGTVNVAAGSYTENLLIDKSVDIVGAGHENTIISGAHTITSSNVLLDGMSFDVAQNTVGITIDSSGSTIDTVIIQNSKIDMEKTTGPFVGIWIGGNTPTNPLTNITIYNNIFAGPGDMNANTFKIGGGFGEPRNCAVNGLDFTNNTVTKSSIPINLGDANITDILIDNNNFASTDGVVYVWNDYGTTPSGVLSQFVFSNNEVANSNTYGVGIDIFGVFADANFGVENLITGNNFAAGIPGMDLTVLTNGVGSFQAVSINSALTTYVLPAENNWWGSYAGPGGTDGGGRVGSAISSNVPAKVDADPWTLGQYGIDSDSDTQNNDIDPDDDGDGYNDNIETNAGTDELDNSSYPAAPAVVYVDDGWSDQSGVDVYNANNSTSLTWNIDAFDTIQEGINAVQSGGTVNVLAGLYECDLIIQKSLELAGEDKATTTIKGIATEPWTSFPLATQNIDVQADSVSINGFTIESPNVETGSYSSGLVITGLNNAIYENIFSSVSVNDVNDPEVDGGCIVIQTYRDDIPGYNSDISGMQIYNNTFQGTPGGGYVGIFINHTLTGEGSVTINGNSMEGNIVQGVFTERYNTTIDDNTFNAAEFAGWAILIQDFNYRPQNNVIASNNIVSNFDSGGILVGRVNSEDPFDKQLLTNISITGNEVSGNAVGIRVRSSAGGVLITQNSISGNTTNSVMNTDPDAGILNASLNWWGINVPETVEDSLDATSPIDFTPLVDSEIDVDDQSNGFQPSMDSLTVHTLGSQSGSVTRIQEAINSVQ
ncbi:MAG: hypothetical protein C4527_20940 [Candidatus Omnitrophota bacterium]|jgi:parallel beta-helix repeat protein|nr:MAG: hypothetical protein C4527_20940 [Candidatus Omnitrophota bacterium]